jgi:hypothetical protein
MFGDDYDQPGVRRAFVLGMFSGVFDFEIDRVLPSLFR